jgi:large subunit ribosomal protein L25
VRCAIVFVCVQVTGEDVSPGIKKGGFVNLIRRKVSCLCMGDRVPTHFEVDVSKLDLGDRIGLETINYLPPGIEIKEKVTKG